MCDWTRHKLPAFSCCPRCLLCVSQPKGMRLLRNTRWLRNPPSYHCAKYLDRFGTMASFLSKCFLCRNTQESRKPVNYAAHLTACASHGNQTPPKPRTLNMITHVIFYVLYCQAPSHKHNPTPDPLLSDTHTPTVSNNHQNYPSYPWMSFITRIIISSLTCSWFRP